MRLAKYLAHAGIASRRQSEDLIQQGRVKLNGHIVKDLATKIDQQFDQVEFDGHLVVTERLVYILINKPSGYISAVADPQGRPTVVELVGGITERVYPVGRLDYDTEGLLLLSNDGQFTNLMIHPRYKINKKYQASVIGQLDEIDLDQLREGVELEDGVTAPAHVELVDQNSSSATIEITIHEGRKRQIKRMCAAIGHPVISLKRLAFAFLTLDGVDTGHYRFLRQEEVDKLLTLAQK